MGCLTLTLFPRIRSGQLSAELLGRQELAASTDHIEKSVVAVVKLASGTALCFLPGIDCNETRGPQEKAADRLTQLPQLEQLTEA